MNRRHRRALEATKRKNPNLREEQILVLPAKEETLTHVRKSHNGGTTGSSWRIGVGK